MVGVTKTHLKGHSVGGLRIPGLDGERLEEGHLGNINGLLQPPALATRDHFQEFYLTFFKLYKIWVLLVRGQVVWNRVLSPGCLFSGNLLGNQSKVFLSSVSCPNSICF